MFKKTLIGAAVAAFVGASGVSLAATVVTTEPHLNADNDVVQKKEVFHNNGDRTVVKKKTSVNAYGQTTVKKKIVRHTASTTPNVTVIHRTPSNRVVVHKVVRPVPARTTIIREQTTG